MDVLNLFFSFSDTINLVLVTEGKERVNYSVFKMKSRTEVLEVEDPLPSERRNLLLLQ